MRTDKFFRRKALDAPPPASGKGALHRSLGFRDLTALGIAAIIGAGIFSTIGQASADGGPGVALLFIFTGLACGFSALCYAEFASAVPTAGSAYTYAYVTFGQLVAWIIGWGLILEYCVGNITVAISWSDYFEVMLRGWGIHLPAWAGRDYLSTQAAVAALGGQPPTDVMGQQALLAWQTAPQLPGGLRLILDLPALVINVCITALVYVGIRESKVASNLLVVLKLGIIALVLGVGITLIRAENWVPFLPNGIGGVLKGVSGVFFAYIGFDAITTTTEECKNPARDMPRAIFASLILCTLLYVAIALVLTGMVPYHTLRVGDPLAFVFQNADLAPDAKRILVAVIAVSAVVAMTSVLLVFQMGQPRIWMSMSRDGLLPERFGRIHPRFRTPAFATVLTGLGVGVPILFMDLASSTDVTSIGTLFAFVLVCAGMLNLHLRPDYTFRYRAAGWCPPRVALGRWGLDAYPLLTGIAFYLLLRFPPENLQTAPHSLLDALERIPTLLVYGTLLYIGLRSLWRPQPLVPVLGLLSCLYLMAQVPAPSWGTFAIWMLLGLGIYFAYGYRR